MIFSPTLLLADKILTNKLSGQLSLPTIEQWTWVSKSSLQGSSIKKELEQLDKMKTKLERAPTPEHTKNYFYALKSFRAKILYKICFELDNLGMQLTNLTTTCSG